MELARFQHDHSVYSVAFSPDGRKLAYVSADKKNVRIWDLNSKLELARFKHDNDVSSVAFSPDGRKLATSSEDGTSRIWDLESNHKIVLF